MCNPPPTHVKHKLPRDRIAVVMLAVWLSLSPIPSAHRCWCGEIPSVTSMQRFVGPATRNTPLSSEVALPPQVDTPADMTLHPSIAPPHSPARIAQPTLVDDAGAIEPVTDTSDQTHAQRMKRLPVVIPAPAAAADSAPKPLLMPKHDPELGQSGDQPQPNHLHRLPVPAAGPALAPRRLPITGADTGPPAPEFSSWQPPGIALSASDSPAAAATAALTPASALGGLDDDGVEWMSPLTGLSPTRVAATHVGHRAPTPVQQTTGALPNPSGLIDRSVCPSLSWPHADDFSATPLPVDPFFHDTDVEQSVYDDKHPVPTQRPLIEWGRRFYGSGITPPSESWLGETNLVQQQLYLYGDYRSGIATGRNEVGRIDNWASRLNLDLDYRITATERFHAFVGPLNRATQFTRLEREGDDWDYKQFYNLNPVTAFFEGDAGALIGGAAGTPSPFELPVTAGLVPLVFQNGIWFEDAASGVAFAIPARHSRALDWANFDATFFAVFDQLNSPAFGADNHAAQAFGTAWFIDAYDGYIESGYAYLNDRMGLGRSYHNLTASFTRRYFDRISNSVRVIVNAGQDLAKDDRTADGVLLLIENSLVTPQPFTVVPYCNLFSGWERPQSVARAGVSGGVLRNTGINFEIDGLNGYPTLDATGADSAGGSIGIDLIGKDLDHQWLLEGSYVTPHGNRALISGDQYALGTRYQFALSHCSIIRFDTMYGWREQDGDLYGSRLEYRWKF